jgi:hypothetical protein
MAYVLLWLATAGFLFCLFLMIFPQHIALLDRRWKSGLGMAACVLLFSFGGQMLPRAPLDRTNPPVAPPPLKSAAMTAKVLTVKDADYCVGKVELYGEVINAECKIEAAWDDAQFVDFAGGFAKKIGQSIQAGAAEGRDAKYIHITYVTDVKDDLGKLSQDGFMTFTYRIDDLKAAEYKYMLIKDMLNLVSEVSLHPLGYASAEAWCQKHPSDAPAFCKQALR